MPEQGFPRTPEESVSFLQKARERGKKEHAEQAEPTIPEEGEKERVEKAEAEMTEEEIRKEQEKIEEVREKIQELTKEPEKEFEAEQQLPEEEAKAFGKQIKKGRLGKMGYFTKGAIAAPFVLAAGAIYLGYKALKIVFWEHWLKNYFGKYIDALKGPGKKE